MDGGMLRVIVAGEAAEVLRRIMVNEAGEACIRIREFRAGTGWGDDFDITLRLGIDMRDDDDLHVEVASLTFIMNPALTSRYGICFAVGLDANKTPRVIYARSQRRCLS